MKWYHVVLGGICLATALLFAALSGSDTASASVFGRPVFQSGAPTVVSYQGQVTVDGSAYSGRGHIKLAVVNQAGDTTYWSNDGTASGEPADAVEVTVDNGLFDVLLGDTDLPNMTALPASVFDGTERYLRVWFSSDGATFALLRPDRRVAAVPYALQAEEARNAGDADTLDGLHASAFQQHYANVVVVAKSGGDYDTITAALNSISDAGDANRYLVKVMPGVYSERVTMKPYVDIEGAGQLTTRITYAGSSLMSTGTLVGANDAEVRFLTVENTGGTTYAIAIYNTSASPRLTHVTATASGGTSSYGVRNDSSSPTMTDVTVIASGGHLGCGVDNASSSPMMTNVTASASGGTSSYGVINSQSSATMTNVTASASGDGQNYGVRNNNSSPTMTNVTVSASGGTINRSVYNRESSTTIRDSVIGASGGTSNYGIQNVFVTSGSYTVRVDNSQVTGGSYTIWNDSGFTTRVGASLLEGGPVGGSGLGTMTCAGVYDENYTFYASTCP